MLGPGFVHLCGGPTRSPLRGRRRELAVDADDRGSSDAAARAAWQPGPIRPEGSRVLKIGVELLGIAEQLDAHTPGEIRQPRKCAGSSLIPVVAAGSHRRRPDCKGTYPKFKPRHNPRPRRYL